MADVKCAMTKETRPMADCLTCVNHVKDGTSLEWCGYRRDEPERKEVPINALRLQMEEKIRRAEYMYMRGWTKLADNYSYEASRIYREIQRRGENESVERTS